MAEARVRRVDIRPAGLALLGAALVLHLAWRTTGLRTLGLVRLGLVAAVGVNLLWSILVAERARVRVTANGGDARAGRAVVLQVEVTGPAQPVALGVGSWPGGPWAAGPWLQARVPTGGRLEAVPAHRGVLSEVAVAVACHQPFGLAGWVRVRDVALARPLWVGPDPSGAGTVEVPAGGSDDRPGPPDPAGALVRGVRPYRPGDPSRLVHWRATARTAELMVREQEGARVPSLVLGVDLGPGGEPGEAAARRAAATAADALARGWTLVLATVDHRGPRTEVAATALEVQRRLAACTTGTPRPPAGRHQAGLLVSPAGDRPWP